MEWARTFNEREWKKTARRERERGSNQTNASDLFCRRRLRNKGTIRVQRVLKVERRKQAGTKEEGDADCLKMYEAAGGQLSLLWRSDSTQTSDSEGSTSSINV